MSAMWRSIISPASGFPSLSQFAGMLSQLCLTHISSQCTTAVTELASNTAIGKDSTKRQWYHMMSASVSQECAAQKVR